jgi:hypothetical protein
MNTMAARPWRSWATPRQDEAEKRLWLKPRLDELMALHREQPHRREPLLLPISGGRKAKTKPPTP